MTCESPTQIRATQVSFKRPLLKKSEAKSQIQDRGQASSEWREGKGLTYMQEG